MTYTLATTVLGPIDVTEAQIVAAILTAPQQPGWPARTPYSDAYLRHWARRGIHWTGVFGFRTAGLVGQATHETNHLRYTGDVPFGTGNFAGIGATGGVPGNDFTVRRADGSIDHEATIDAGWLAFCCHMALYVYALPEQWPQHLRQYAAHAVRREAVRWAHHNTKRSDGILLGFLGAVSTWGDFCNGRWAHTQSIPVGSMANRYAERSVEKANHVLAQPRGEEGPMDRPGMLRLLDARYPLRIRVAHIPWDNSNRSRQVATAEGRRWIIVHETANTSKGANAEMHRGFTHGKNGYGGGGYPPSGDKPGYEGVSFTWVVDDREAIQLVPSREKTWQASDGSNGVGNSSESIEACVNSDGNWAQTRENTARLIARIIIEDPQRDPSRVNQHFDRARDGKNCPTYLRANNGAQWRSLNSRVQAILTDVGYFGGAMAKEQTNAEQFPTGHWIINAEGAPMLNFFRANGGWERLGYPQEGMRLDPDGVYRQLLDNCELESWPNGFGPYPGPYVRLGGLGMRYKALREGAGVT
jgi:hypothetical protein